MIDKRLIEILACPVCKTGIEYDEENQKIICATCGRKYPVRDGIPDMLEESCER